MRKLLLGLVSLSLLAIGGVSQATVGTVDMTWDSCTGGPVDKNTTTPDYYDLYITVTGHDEAQKGYDVRVVFGNNTHTVPEAWRFDEDGCQTRVGITQDALSKTCPPFSQVADTDSALRIKIVRLLGPYDQWSETSVQVLFAYAYPPVQTVDPGTRYLLERIRFDLNDAVAGEGSPPATCGGFEQPMCFKLDYATFLSLDGQELPLNIPSPRLVVSFNGPSTCPGTVPVRAETWGSIKSQYRQ